jgi:hypothetical protein
MRAIALAAAAMILVGCTTAPKDFEVQRSRDYSAPRAAVWDRAVRYFANSQYQVKTISAPEGVIRGDRGRMFPQSAGDAERRAGFWNGYADCGNEFTSLPEGQSVEMTVVVREEAGRTRATVNTIFRETYFDISGWGAPTPRDCNSTGVLEQQVLDALERS